MNPGDVLFGSVTFNPKENVCSAACDADGYLRALWKFLFPPPPFSSYVFVFFAFSHRLGISYPFMVDSSRSISSFSLSLSHLLFLLFLLLTSTPWALLSYSHTRAA